MEVYVFNRICVKTTTQVITLETINQNLEDIEEDLEVLRNRPVGGDNTPSLSGSDGKSAYQLWLDAGNTGTQAQYLASLKGGKGDVGSDGKSAYQLWLDAGNTGTQAQYLASLKGGKGDVGNEGKSAYQVWLDAGNTGTQAQYLASLKGGKGDVGNEGKSAYQVWLDAGNTGTQAQYLASLKGADGTVSLTAVLNPKTVNYTVVASDLGRVIKMNSASATTVTIPASLGAGFNCLILQEGAGQVTITVGAGATLRNGNSHTKTQGQWATVTVLFSSATDVVIAGATA